MTNFSEKLPIPPCQHCSGACCKQEPGYRPYAVELLDSEANKYPLRVAIRDDACAHGGYALPYVNGHCVYLGDDDRCTIYEDRPQLCRNFNCLAGWKLRGEYHGTFLDDRPEVVEIIQLHVPGYQDDAH